MTEQTTPPDMNMEVDETIEESEVKKPFEEFLEHQRRALEETGRALEALLPEGFQTHAGNASREFTEGFRVLVNAAMKEFKAAKEAKDDLEEEQDEPPSSTTGKTKVKVQVE